MSDTGSAAGRVAGRVAGTFLPPPHPEPASYALVGRLTMAPDHVTRAALLEDIPCTVAMHSRLECCSAPPGSRLSCWTAGPKRRTRRRRTDCSSTVRQVLGPGLPAA